MIRIDENKISLAEFNYLTDKVDWGTRDANVVEEALNKTLYSVSIYDDNKIIEYGRIIGDKIIFLYITYLGAFKGKEEFYEKFKFKTRSRANLGEGIF